MRLSLDYIRMKCTCNAISFIKIFKSIYREIKNER